MIEAVWFVVLSFVSLASVVTVTALHLREQRRLTNALVARNGQEYAMIDRSNGQTKSAPRFPKRRIAEVEGSFDDTAPRPLGL